MENAREYYRGHGAMTKVSTQAAKLNELPNDIPTLCKIIQGVLIHRELAAWLYNLKLLPEQNDKANIRPFTAMLAGIQSLDNHPLAVARGPAARLPCVCRHFTTMLCTILREQGTPARARVGFGAYFNPGRFEDHWVCEYWNAAQGRWMLVDAQLDPQQQKAFKLDFDPLDVPRNRFIIAGDAWQMCRSGRADPATFGLSLVPHLRGLWFIAGNVIRDLAALNRAEMLPWDVWGMMVMDDASLTEDQRALLDRVAAVTLAADDKLAELRLLYESDERLRVPEIVFNAMRQAPERVAI
jgi:hypothetical protein